MSQFIEITHYEFSMSIRRVGFWIAYLLLGGFYVVSVLVPSVGDSAMAPEQVWPQAGHLVFLFNIFMPLLAGILSADRMQRDFQSSIRELQRSTPFSDAAYILAKYFGVLGSVLLPIFLVTLLTGVFMVAMGLAPMKFLGALLAAFIAIVVPAHAFVVAFSLACPLVIPLRIYQVLFTGYWFWGNLISPKAFPTISETVLNAVGQYPLQAYFGVWTDSTSSVTGGFTQTQAVINLIVLILCIAAALTAARFYLHAQSNRS